MPVEGQEGLGAIRGAMNRAEDVAQAKPNERRSERNERDDRNDSRRDRDRGGRDRDRDREEARREESRYTQGRATASLANIGRRNPTPIAMSATAEALEQFRKDFVEAMPSKEDNNMLQCQVFPIDAANSGVPFSMITVAGIKRDKPELGVGFHTFLIAASADPLKPREESYRSTRITVVNTAGEGYDDRARDIVREILRAHYPNTDKFYSGEAETIHDRFPTAKEDEAAIADCVKNAFAAIKSALDRNDDTVALLTLKDEGRESYNTIHVQHRQNHIFDRGNLPIRADAIIDLSSRESRGRNSRDVIDQMVPGTRITRVGGYYDLFWSPSKFANSRNSFRRNNDNRRMSDDEYQIYVMRFITTFIDTIDYSPQAALLAQATVCAMDDEAQWMRAFEPNMELNEIDDMRNIGGLAIETNLDNEERGFSDPIPTKVPTFTQAKRRALLRATIQPGMMYSIDIPECGASTWQYYDFLGAAEGNQRCMTRIYDAACFLTDGVFEDYWRRDDPIFDTNVERHVGGYYTQGDGGRRLDLRDFDYLALLNLLRPESEEDMRTVQKWSMASAVAEDDLICQSDRFEILRDFIPSYKVTGHYQRFNWDAEFIHALTESVMKCNLSLNPDSSGRDRDERFRSTYSNIDRVHSTYGTNGLFRNQRNRYDRDQDRYSDDRRSRHAERYSSY